MPVPDDSSAEESVYDAATKPFRPYEPEPVQPSSSPAPSSTSAPGFGGTSGEDGKPRETPAEPQAAEPPKQPDLPEFDPRWREPFTGLLYLGRLEDTFTIWGHQFVVKTLTTEELAEISLYMARYEGTRAANAVYQSAVVAAAVVSVDGQTLPLTLGFADSGLKDRIDYVNRNWMPAVREHIWDKVFALEEKVRDVLAAMGKASG